MSLIYDALRQPAGPATGGAAPFAPAPAPSRRRWLPALAAFAVTLAIGTLLLAWWLRTQPPAMAMASPLPAVPAVAVPLLATPAAPMSDSAPPPAAMVRVPASVNAPADTPVPVRTADSAVPESRVSEPRTVVRTPVVRGTAAAASARRAPTGAVRTASPAAASAPAPAVTTMPVPVRTTEQRYGDFLQAMQGKDLPGAALHLEALRGLLGRNSVSLLRAEGWYALAAGDLPTAQRSYAEVLDRLPGDEQASINLASIHVQQGRAEAGRAVLNDALRGQPESEPLRAAMLRFRKAQP